jgi:hypothetical protein
MVVTKLGERARIRGSEKESRSNKRWECKKSEGKDELQGKQTNTHRLE